MSLSPEARAGLRKRYVERLPRRRAALEAALAGIRAGESEAVAEARSQGHQFSGTGASFGFPELSDAGRELEGAPEDGIGPAIERLLSLVDQVIHGGSSPGRDCP